MEVRELAVLRDGRRAPHGTACRNLYSLLLPGQLGIPATPEVELACGGAGRGEPVSWDQAICFATVAVV